MDYIIPPFFIGLSIRGAWYTQHPLLCAAAGMVHGNRLSTQLQHVHLAIWVCNPLAACANFAAILSSHLALVEALSMCGVARAFVQR